eukprot:GGOE01065438.1.p2 GENE.GGOE01065438.1~~GGOE01065438.1.p2  ORF type:complete len:378 (-),score=72.66 GGOE01065438.1:544-1656(-)
MSYFLSPTLGPQAPPMTPPCTPPFPRAGIALRGRRLFASPEGRKRRLSCEEADAWPCSRLDVLTPTRSDVPSRPPCIPGTPSPDSRTPPAAAAPRAMRRLLPHSGEGEEDGVPAACATPPATPGNPTPGTVPPPTASTAPEGLAPPEGLGAAPEVSIAVGLQCLTALMRTEPWFTLEDPEDRPARLFELKVWQFVKMTGSLDEEECSLDTGLSFGGLGDSLQALNPRLQRLVRCLRSDSDSLALLDKLCVASTNAGAALRELLVTLLPLLNQRPFLPLKAASLAALREKLEAVGADSAVLCRAAEQAACLAALANTLDRLLDSGVLNEWRAVARDPDAAAHRGCLERQRMDAVRSFNQQSQALVLAFTRR